MTDTATAMDLITQRMRGIGATPPAIDSFLRQYRQLVAGQSGFIESASIEPVTELPDADKLAAYADAGTAALPKTLIVKLNGGLGTSMGLDRAKSLLPVKNGKTFLDVVVGQVLEIRLRTRTEMPLVLMDSFNTHDDTMAALQKYPELAGGQKGIPVAFVQDRVPKIRQDNLLPVDWIADSSREWCPPGHGNLYLAMATSGTLQALLRDGFEYAFVTNVDNLGATLSLPILGFFAEQRLPFLMEVTDRTEADKKGGHLARARDGRLILRERAQCPPAEEKDFQDVRKYRFFNTNNLWVNLQALKRALDRHGNMLDLPLIVNRKNVDPSDPKSTPVYQLETAMGAAIAMFSDAQAVRVPRSRFSPVKTAEDMLALWSDAYTLADDMHLTLAPERKGRPVVLHLDPKFFATYQDLLARFPHGAPSLVNCESLTIHGDFRFGRNVVVRGNAVLKNDGPGQNTP